jgi:hypothetical protein
MLLKAPCAVIIPYNKHKYYITTSHSRLDVFVENCETNFIVAEESQEGGLLPGRHHDVQTVTMFTWLFPEVESWTVLEIF